MLTLLRAKTLLQKAEFLLGLVLAASLLTPVGQVLEAKTTVTVWYPWNDFDGELFVARTKEFNQLQSEVEIKPVFVEGGGIPNGKLSIAVATGKVPDLVLYWGSEQAGSLGAAKVLQPIDRWLKEAQIDSTDYFPAAWMANVYQDKVYGIPEMLNVNLLFYNNRSFDEAGLDSTKPPSTITEIDEVSYKITKFSADRQLTRMGWVPWSWQGHEFFWSWAFSANIYQHSKLSVNSPQVLAALRWQANYMNRYGLANVENFLSGDAENGGNVDYFADGRLVMRIDGEWKIRFYLQETQGKVSFAVAPAPTADPSRPRPSWVFGNTWYVPSGAKHPAEALKFVAWFNQPELSRDVADKVWNVSPVIKAAQSQKLLNDHQFRVAIQQVGSPGAGTNFTSKYLTRIQQEVHDAFWNGIHQKDTPENVLNKAQQALEAFIASQGGPD
ncbi:MAG: extracellular solute-binding protein [Limnochordaceae bacterium]|nr:extracellular solute-binding protein [Limnochordaceae bacterium]